MIFRQYELSCLSQFSYLVADEATGRAVVVDPQRDVSAYVGDAEALGVRIERVIETHFHADFLSGHLELAAATGAAVSYGSGAETEYPMEPLADGERLSLGDVVLEVRHTPGHTPESISVVIWERGDAAEPWGVITGDTLFVGGVGRPDLLASSGWTAEALARRLYHSLHERLLSLPDGTRVFPAHGAGSSCGKSLGTAPMSTVGEQRVTNDALRPMTEDAFVEIVTDGQPIAPPYYGFASSANRRAHDLLDDHRPPPSVDIDELLRLQREGAVVVDGRAPDAFAGGHLLGSVNVGLDGRFAEYAGDVIRPDDPIVVVTDAGREIEARVRLARIGFDRVVGALAGIDAVLAARPHLAARAPRLSAAELSARLAGDTDLQLLDVRNPGETVAGVVAGARAIPLACLVGRLDELDRAAATVVYCAGGYRSSIAASVLRAAGFADVADLAGGYAAWLSRPAAAGRATVDTARRDRGGA